MRGPVLAAAALSALLLPYIGVAGRWAAGLIATGEPVAVGLGAAALVMPALGVWLLIREWLLAIRVQRMADELAARGELAVDDLPRTPAGRIDRAAADRAFAGARLAVEEAPRDWSCWFRLGFAYDGARDRRRARAALRTAVRLRRGDRV